MIVSAWIEVNGRPVEAYAENNLVNISWELGVASIGFKATTSELNALALGQDYTVQEDYQDFTLLGATGKPGYFTLKDLSGKSNYKLIVDFEKWSAYYLLDTNESKGKQIDVVEEITGASQICVSNTGKFKVSNNLYNKQVRVRARVLFPKLVIIGNKPFEAPVVIRVVEEIQGKRKLLSQTAKLITKSNPQITGNLRTLEFEFIPNSQQCQNLSD